jgi:hypothetical protein
MPRKTLELGLLNLVSYFVLTVDFRSVAQANIGWSIVTNLVIALITFSILKRVHEASTLADRIAYAIGGASGTVIGIELTLKCFGK